MQLRLITRSLLAVLSGVLYFSGFVGYDQFYLSWICLTPLLVALHGSTWRQSIVIGWTMGLTTHLGGYTWIIDLLREFAGAPVPVAFSGYVLLCAAQGAFFAVFSWVLTTLSRSGIRGSFWLPPVIHAGLELVYPFLFRSFLANSQIHFLSFMQIAEVVGVIGMGFIMVLVSSLLAETVLQVRAGKTAPYRGWILAALLVTGSVAFGRVRIQQIDTSVTTAPHIRVGLIQTNLGQGDKNRSPNEWVSAHLTQTEELVANEPDLDLIVWPETAYNRYIPRNASNLRQILQQGHSIPMLTGILTRETNEGGGGERRYNSAVLIDSIGEVQGVFDKNRLLAFGEYVPLGHLAPRVARAIPTPGRFTPGQTAQPLDLGEIRLAVHICYEDILPRFVRRLMRAEEGRRPQLLVNLTNDSWFGDTIEPRIHLALAAFRAVENRRTLVRATNTGISAMVDPVGRISPSIPQYQQGNLVVDAPLLDGTTVYQRAGDVLGWLCLCVTILMLIASGTARRVRTRDHVEL